MLRRSPRSYHATLPHATPCSRHASLDASLILDVHASMAPAWPAALRDGTVVTTDEQCLPAGLLDEKGPRQQYAVAHSRTLVQRAVAPVRKLKLKHIYTAMTTAVFQMPRTFDPHAGGAARHAHLFERVAAGDARVDAVARAVKCIRHPAVPSEMTETAHKVAFSGFAFGPNKRGICQRDTCPCGGGHAETVEHTFKDCPRSRRLWELVTASSKFWSIRKLLEGSRSFWENLKVLDSPWKLFKILRVPETS